MTLRGFGWMRAAVALTLTAALVASPALAGPRDHADGFFLRLSAGAGEASTENDTGADRIELSGTATDIDFAIGAIVAPNLALHGTLFGWMMEDPDATLNGLQGTLNGDVTAAGLGIGLTWYLMPANVYLTGTIGSGTMELDGALVDGETDRGVMLDFALGKEWWVGDKWGLGASFGVQFHSLGDPDVTADWTGTSYALRFTATMN